MAPDTSVKYVVAMLVLSFGVGHVEAEVPEGSPGSPQRKGLCAEGKRDCEAKIDTLCGESITDNTQEDFESVEVEICRAKHKKACDERWGETCVTSPRTFGFSHEIEEYGGTNTTAPRAVRRPPPRPGVGERESEKVTARRGNAPVSDVAAAEKEEDVAEPRSVRDHRKQ